MKRELINYKDFYPLFDGDRFFYFLFSFCLFGIVFYLNKITGMILLFIFIYIERYYFLYIIVRLAMYLTSTKGDFYIYRRDLNLLDSIYLLLSDKIEGFYFFFIKTPTKKILRKSFYKAILSITNKRENFKDVMIILMSIIALIYINFFVYFLKELINNNLYLKLISAGMYIVTLLMILRIHYRSINSNSEHFKDIENYVIIYYKIDNKIIEVTNVKEKNDNLMILTTLIFAIGIAIINWSLE